jgi:hypothetical protein
MERGMAVEFGIGIPESLNPQFNDIGIGGQRRWRIINIIAL